MIIALDPGITTGVAELWDNGKIYVHHMKEPHLEFYRFLETGRVTLDEIVYESFVYQRRNKVVLYPVEVIGVIKLFCATNAIPAYSQSASQAKGFMTDDKLKAMGLWEEGLKHGMDALRHLMYHLIVTKGERQWLNKLNPDS